MKGGLKNFWGSFGEKMGKYHPGQKQKEITDEGSKTDFLFPHWCKAGTPRDKHTTKTPHWYGSNLSPFPRL